MSTLGKTIQVLAVALLCFAGGTSAFSSQAGDSARGNVQGAASLIAEELRHCPLWIDVPPQDTRRRQEITNIYLEIARYQTNVIRAGVYMYVKSYAPLGPRYIEAGYKVFALERVVFKVPTRFRVGQRFPYAVLGNPLRPGNAATYIDFLWPYSIGGAGQLVLSGFGVGQLSGPPYNPTADFDRMAGLLTRRTLEAPATARP